MKTHQNPALRYAYCQPCGKRGYPERRAAKWAARQMHDKGVGVYWCQHGGEFWHVGHLWAAVVAGELPRSQIKPHSVRPA